MNSTIRDAQAQLERVQAEIAARTRELSSGRRLNTISDDPLATRGAIVQRAEVAKLDSYTKATDSVDSRLSVTDSILSDVIVQITAALTAAAGSRGSHVSPAQHEAYAIQLEGIRDTILADVNTQFNGTYLFSGGGATTEPYTKTGGVVSAYQGTATVVSVDVSESLAVQVSRNGDALLRGADANDLFVEFDLLITAVRAGDAVGIDAGIAALNRAIDRATAAQSHVGSDWRLALDRRLQLGVRRVEGAKQISRHEDANLVESITALQSAQAGYEAALRAIALQAPLSLMNLLR